MSSDYPPSNMNKGAVWPNSYKTRRNQPDCTGKIDVEGIEYRIAMWEYEGDNSRAPAFNFQIEKREDYNKRINNQNQQQSKPSNNFDDFDDDIPF